MRASQIPLTRNGALEGDVDAEPDQQVGEQPSHDRRAARRDQAIAAHPPQEGAEDASAVHREARDEVEDPEHDVDEAQPAREGRELLLADDEVGPDEARGR